MLRRDFVASALGAIPGAKWLLEALAVPKEVGLHTISCDYGTFAIRQYGDGSLRVAYRGKSLDLVNRDKSGWLTYKCSSRPCATICLRPSRSQPELRASVDLRYISLDAPNHHGDPTFLEFSRDLAWGGEA